MTFASLVMLACDGKSRLPPDKNSLLVTVQAPGKCESEELAIHLGLTVGASFGSEMAAGATHVYRFALEADQYLHLAVDQDGVDVLAKVFTLAAEEPVLEVDSPTLDQGIEDLTLVADASGDYCLTIFALKGEGRYRTSVEALRRASADDQLQAAAARAFSQAQRFEQHGDDWELAVEHYRTAADHWHRLGEKAKESRAQYLLGKLYTRGGRLPEAMETLQRARTLFEQVGDLRYQALTLDWLGKVLSRRRSLERARRASEASLRLWRELGELSGQASMLNDLGLVAKRQGRLRPALEYYGQALELWRHLGRRRHQAATLSNLGVLYSMLGEHRQALDFHRRALALVDPRRDPNQTAITLTKMADALVELREIESALDHYRRALALRRERRDERGEAVTHNGIGWAQQLSGRPREALESFQTALGILAKFGDLKAQATVLNNLGTLYTRLDQAARARKAFEGALEKARVTGHRSAEAVALMGQARVARRKGLLADAQNHVEEALSVFESIRGLTGRGDLRSAYLASKQKHYAFLVDLLAERHRRDPQAGFDGEAFEVSERARARSLLEALSEIRTTAVRGVTASDLQHLAELRGEIDIRHLERLRLIRQEAPSDALEPLDQQLRVLFETLRQTEARLRRDSPEWSALVEPEVLSLPQVQDQLLDQETLLLEFFLGKDRSFLWAVTQDKSTLHVLPDRTSIEKAAVWTYQTMIESHLQTGEMQSELAAQKLSRMLLEPVAERLERRRLVIVAPGALQYVPFAALPDPTALDSSRSPAKPLVVSHEIVSLPSVSVLNALRWQSASRRPAPKQIAVLADPIFEMIDPRLPARNRRPVHSSPGFAPSLSRLRHSADEAAAILRLAEGLRLSRSLSESRSTLAAFDFEASRDLVKSGRLADYRILHFSTHGVLDTEHPELSALVLSLVDREGQAVDGYLRAYEIFNLDLPADLVVLSACRTALGKQVRGEGLVGLTRAFMHAGASRVAVSLWNVNDRATAELMRNFYAYLLRDGLSPGRALQAAQVSMWRSKQWHAPFFWAGFILQGDWRGLETSRRWTL